LAKPPARPSLIVEQLFVGRPRTHITNTDDFERKLYVLRRYINKTVTETIPAAAEHFYFTSLSLAVPLFIKGR
jgi:glutamate synthase (NADPH/NADH) large chain